MLATLEHHTSMWCEKALRYEEMCLKLEEELQQSTMELDGFRSHCSELEEIIQSLRPKHISIECDSPLRLNTTTSTSVSLSENMGEVFVDLLLREKEEENARLMDDINLIKTEKQELECDLKKRKSELDNFYTQRQSLEAANKVLLLKNQKHCINTFILNEKIQCLRENIVKITVLKETTKTELVKTKCQLEEMVSLRDILLTKNDKITKQANDDIEHLSLEKETLKQAYTSSTKEYERNLGSLTHNMNVLKQQLIRIEGEKAVLEVCNTKLSEDKVKLQQTIHTHEENELSLRKNIDSLSEITVCLENTKSDLEIKNVQLLETIDACENKSSSFQNEIYKLESVQAQQVIKLGHLIEEQKSHLLEIESLRNSLEDLTTSKEKLVETVDRLTLSNEETVNKWTGHALGLETKVSELDEQLHVMKTYLASLQSELVEVNNIKASLEDKYNTAIVKYKHDIDSLNEEVYLINHNLSISQENKATLEHTNRNLSKEIEILQKLNDSLERDNINFQSNVNELELTNKQCESKINHLVEENNEQIVKLEKLEINLSDAFKKINDHEAVISDMACSNKQEVDSWITQVSSLEANIILLKDEIQNVQTELAKTINEKLSLEKTFSIVSKESEDNINALNKQIKALNKKILILEETKKIMEEKETRLFGDIKSKEESLNYYINEIECLKSDIHELELVKNKQRLEIDRLFEEKNSNVAKIQQLRVSLSAVSQEKYDLQIVINQMNLSSVSSMENWTSHTASMGKRIEEMQKEIYNLTQKLECAQIKLEEEKTCKAELQQSHISCTQKFEYNLVSLKQAMSVLEQTLSNTDAEKVVLQKQNKELEEENAKLRETITQANEESSKLNYSVKELKSAHCVQIAELEKKQSLIAQLEITNTKLEASIILFKNKSQESFSLMKLEMEDRINTLKEEKESISKELEAAKQIEEQLLEKDVVIENLKTKSINLDLIIEKLKLENSSHCNSLDSINVSLLEERTKKDALLQEIACVKDSNTKLLNRINTLEEENEKHCFNIGTLEKHIKDEKESKEQITYKFDGDIKLAYEKNSEMQAEISRFAQEIKVLKEEETSLKEKVSELESKNKNLAQLFEESYKIWNVERQITEKLNILSVSCDLKEELDTFFSSYNSIKLKCKNILSQKSTSIAETKKINTFLTELADIFTRLEENTIAPTIMFEIKLTNASWALEKLGHLCNTMEVRAESTAHSSYLQDDITEHTIAMKEKIEIVQLKISNLKGELVIGEEKCKMLASLLTNIAKTTSDGHASSINMEIEDNGWDPDDSLEMAVASKSLSIDHIENQDKLGGVNTVSIRNFTRLKELNSNYEKKLNEMKDLISVYFEQKEAALKKLDDLKRIAVPLAAYDKCMAENKDLRIKVMELKNKLIFVEKQSTDTQTMKQFIEERVRHEFEEKLDRAKQEMTKLMNEELKKKKQLAIMEKASNEQGVTEIVSTAVAVKEAGRLRNFLVNDDVTKSEIIWWLQNIEVAERAETILPNVVAYVNESIAAKKAPNCRSFHIISTSVKDKLLAPKLAFFQSVAIMVEPFLIQFQSDAPLAPFLYEALISLMKSLMKRFVKSDKLDSARSLLELGIFNETNLLNAKYVDLGYATREAIRKTKGVSEKEILLFRQDCKTCLQKLCAKLLERSPLKYKLTKAISFLDPAVAVLKSTRSERLKSTLEIVLANNWITGVAADLVDRQFNSVCSQPDFLEKMNAFSKQHDRLDTLWMSIIPSNDDNQKLVSFLRLILILSHGNASLERGFSINRECIVENLNEASLIAQRQIYDSVKAIGGIEKVDITKSLIHSVRNARSRYKDSLEQKMKDKQNGEKQEGDRKRAAVLQKELQAKKQKILSEAQKQADILQEEIESLKKK
uniref:(California timema) hypothetical protein n=1 Tax=Timema californicum TaxID=61474 RepID=A0A7R9J436_TIMCA|nr:unnamed protein product [Timema californicum]